MQRRATTMRTHMKTRKDERKRAVASVDLARPHSALLQVAVVRRRSASFGVARCPSALLGVTRPKPKTFPVWRGHETMTCVWRSRTRGQVGHRVCWRVEKTIGGISGGLRGLGGFKLRGCVCSKESCKIIWNLMGRSTSGCCLRHTRDQASCGGQVFLAQRRVGPENRQRQPVAGAHRVERGGPLRSG